MPFFRPLAFAFCVALTACGQSGDLYLPGDKSPAVAGSAAPAPLTPAAPASATEASPAIDDPVLEPAPQDEEDAADRESQATPAAP